MIVRFCVLTLKSYVNGNTPERFITTFRKIHTQVAYVKRIRHVFYKKTNTLYVFYIASSVIIILIKTT